MRKLKAHNSRIIFSFVEQVTAQRMFQLKTASGIIIRENHYNQVGSARWGKVLAVGDKVSDEVKVGQYILIHPLKWTNHIEIDKQKIWNTAEEFVLAVSDENPIQQQCY